MLTIDRITFGTATLGNLSSEMSDADATAILETAWHGGIRRFDTAPHYGLGLAELRLGRFLATAGHDDAVVSTKVGRVLRPNPDPAGERDLGHGFDVPTVAVREWDPSLAGVRTSLTQSLERLGLDRVEALYLHDPDEYPDEQHSINEGLAALDTLRREGTVDQIGVGSKSTATLEIAAADPRTTEIMVAGRHTLVDQSAAQRVLPACRARGTHVVVAAVFGSGLLARPEPAGTYDYRSAPTEIIERARSIASVCAHHGSDLPTAALHFAGRDPVVSSVVLGARSPDQLRENLRRLKATPPQALWVELAERGLIATPGQA